MWVTLFIVFNYFNNLIGHFPLKFCSSFKCFPIHSNNYFTLRYLPATNFEPTPFLGSHAFKIAYANPEWKVALVGTVTVPKRWWIGWKASKMAAAPELVPLNNPGVEKLDGQGSWGVSVSLLLLTECFFNGLPLNWNRNFIQ